MLSLCLFQSFLLATFSSRQRNVDFGFRGAISFLSELRLLDVQHIDTNPGLKTDYCNIGKMHSSHPPLFKKMTKIIPDTHVFLYSPTFTP